MRQAWPLVGRQPELERLARVLQASAATEASGAVIAGAAGVGKTRLVRELVAALGDNVVTEWIAVTEASASVPLGPLAHLLPPGGATGEMDRLERIRQATAAVGALRRNRRLVLAIDDAHLLDDSSAAVVHRVTLQREADVLITVRSGAPAPEPVTALWKDGLLERVDLQALSPSDAGALIAAVLAGPIEPEVHEALWRSSQGNALLLREVVLDALDTGRLAQVDGRWVWRGVVTPGARLADLVGSRLAALPADERQLLTLVAQYEPTAPFLLGERPDVLESVQGLEQRGLVTTELDGHRTVVRLGHPLYGEVVRAGLTPFRRQLLDQVYVDRLARTGLRRRGDTLRFAATCLRASLPLEPAMAIRAARAALATFDYGLAESLARFAFGSDVEAEARLVLGQVLNEIDRHAEAVTVLSGLRPSVVGDELRAPLLLELAIAQFWSGASVDDVAALVADAIPSTRDVAQRQELEAFRVSALATAGRVRQAVDAGNALLADPDLTERALLRVLTGMGPAMAMTGRGDQALALSVRCLEVASRHTADLPLALSWAVETRLLALLILGRFGELDPLLSAAYAMFEQQRSDDLRARVGMLRGRVAVACGQIGSARGWLAEAAAVLRTTDPVRFLPWCLAVGAEAAALSGEPETANALLCECDAIARPTRIYAVDIERARAWAATAEGDTAHAVAILIAYADDAAKDGLLAGETLALHDALRLGDETVADRLAAVAAAVDGVWAAAMAEHARAVVDDDATRFERAASRFVEMGAWMLAAEALVGAAESHRRAGRVSRAFGAEERARRALGRTDHPRTPLLAWLSPELPLSRREREIVELAVAGMNARQMANQLYVSVRTIESHLHAAYGKLGVANRQELVDVIGSDADRLID